MKGLGVMFWSNTGLEGKPAARSLGIPGVTSGAVDHDWGTGSPISGVSAGNWSSRHTREIQMAAGNYGFSLAAVDGARLWIDDLLVVDNWVASPLTETGSITVAAGRHGSGSIISPPAPPPG